MNETTGEVLGSLNMDVVIDPCVECGQSTMFGSGRYVNRLPFDDGYKCIECLGSVFECDRCGKDIPFDEDVTVPVFDDLADEVIDEVRLGPCCHFQGFHN